MLVRQNKAVGERSYYLVDTEQPNNTPNDIRGGRWAFLYQDLHDQATVRSPYLFGKSKFRHDGNVGLDELEKMVKRYNDNEIVNAY